MFLHLHERGMKQQQQIGRINTSSIHLSHIYNRCTVHHGNLSYMQVNQWCINFRKESTRHNTRIKIYVLMFHLRLTCHIYTYILLIFWTLIIAVGEQRLEWLTWFWCLRDRVVFLFFKCLYCDDYELLLSTIK